MRVVKKVNAATLSVPVVTTNSCVGNECRRSKGTGATTLRISFVVSVGSSIPDRTSDCD